jgi:hypothetical protein
MQNQITAEQIHQFANIRGLEETLNNASNDEFFFDLRANHGEEGVNHFIDNLALCFFGYQVDAETEDTTEDATTDDIRKVYQAAKVMFAKHPGKTFEFDLESAYAGIGSPWCHQCETPEEWVISWSRRYLETDEGTIDHADENMLYLVLDLMRDLHWVGVSQEVVRENLAYICYDNEDLIKRLSFN